MLRIKLQSQSELTSLGLVTASGDDPGPFSIALLEGAIDGIANAATVAENKPLYIFRVSGDPVTWHGGGSQQNDLQRRGSNLFRL